MSGIYSGVYSTVKVEGATFVPSPLLPATAFPSSRPSPPAALLLDPSHLIQLLPALKQLSTSPIVLQVSTLATQDHAPILALRGSGLAILYSSNASQAKANALVAARVAATGRGVVHFGEFEQVVDLGFEGVTGEWIVSRDSTSEEGSTNGTVLKPTLAALFSTVFSTLPAVLAASPSTYTGSSSPETLIVALGNASALAAALPSNVALLSINLYRPLSPSQIRQLVPAGVKTVVTLEQVHKKVGKWSPLFLDIVGAFAEADEGVEVPAILSGTLGEVLDGAAAVQVVVGKSCTHTSRLMSRSRRDPWS